MTHIITAHNWATWISDGANQSADENTKLEALREYIKELAERAVSDGHCTAAWANKKLAKLGVTHVIADENRYVVEYEITGKVSVAGYGISRADFLEHIDKRFDNGTAKWTATSVKRTSPAVFTSGPADPDPQATAADDAPKTVTDTLTALREVIMLGVLAGPHFCADGANEKLAEFGLDPIPARKMFVISRPATVTMTTSVEAYDEASARRVADWRWEDDHAAYNVKDAQSAGDVEITAR